MAQLERRLTRRKLLERLTYIDMPGGNGGIITDVSEGGLGFHVVSPLEATGSVHFLLSGGSNRIGGHWECAVDRRTGQDRGTELHGLSPGDPRADPELAVSNELAART